jgi:hypothetical protein
MVFLRPRSGYVNKHDAVVDAAGNLVALPVLAWYTAYEHNWTDFVRSTATYSQVFLDSIDTPTQSDSPYRLGQYVQANLVYHNSFRLANEDGPPSHLFFTGLEWTYGKKEALDGDAGEANRLMWVIAFSK